MNWLQKIAGPEDYLATLGAPPETIQWVMSQPDPQFYINEYRKNPGVDVTTLQPKQQYEPTFRENQRIIYYEDGDPRRKWVLGQLRQMRGRPYPLQNGEMDYEYPIALATFDNKMSQIDDWYTISNENPNVPNIDLFKYTWDQAVEASDAWHAIAAGEGAGIIYEPTNPDLVMFQPKEWEGWSIQKVVSENDLKSEGTQMDHCVGQYCRRVNAGETEVYSLRDPNNKPHVTLEIEPEGSVNQIYGKSNSEPKDEYKEFITQWFDEFKKTRPGLRMADQEFDFDDLRHVDNSQLDERINEIVYGAGGEENYGLQLSLSELDVQYPYDAVINALSGGNFRGSDTRYVSHIGPVLAKIAWDADKQRAEDFGILFPEVVAPEKIEKFKYQSSQYGVHWLWEKIEKNSEDFWKYFIDYDSWQKREDFATEEEYEAAVTEERDEAEMQARSESLPSALDDEIAKALNELAKTDPYLPEHKAYQDQKVASNWLQRVK